MKNASPARFNKWNSAKPTRDLFGLLPTAGSRLVSLPARGDLPIRKASNHEDNRRIQTGAAKPSERGGERAPIAGNPVCGMRLVRSDAHEQASYRGHLYFWQPRLLREIQGQTDRLRVVPHHVDACFQHDKRHISIGLALRSLPTVVAFPLGNFHDN